MGEVVNQNKLYCLIVIPDSFNGGSEHPEIMGKKLGFTGPNIFKGAVSKPMFVGNDFDDFYGSASLKKTLSEYLRFIVVLSASHDEIGEDDLNDFCHSCSDYFYSRCRKIRAWFRVVETDGDFNVIRVVEPEMSSEERLLRSIFGGIDFMYESRGLRRVQSIVNSVDEEITRLEKERDKKKADGEQMMLDL